MVYANIEYYIISGLILIVLVREWLASRKLNEMTQELINKSKEVTDLQLQNISEKTKTAKELYEKAKSDYFPNS